MDNAETWQLVIFGMRGEDVAFERSFASDDASATTLLTLGEVVPSDEEIRLLVRGYDVDTSGRSALVALAASGPLVLPPGGDQAVCLCVATPESYGNACYQRFCTFGETTGCSFQGPR